MNLKKAFHAAAAGGLVLGLSVFGNSAAAREAQAIPGTFRSSIVVANPGTVEANVSMNFVKSDGSAAMASPLTFRVPAGASQLQYVPNIAGLADGRYSVVIDSDQNVVAIANLASDSPSTSTAYNGISQTDVGRSFSIPSVYKNYFGFSSSIVVQNAGTAAANVRISYRNTGGEVASETRSIPANASSTFDQQSSSLSEGFIGSAVVTSDQDVAAIFLVSASGQLSSSRGAKSGAPIVYLPVAYNQYFSYNTNILVQNVDTTATTVEVTYYDSRSGAALSPTETATIQPGSSATFFQFDTARGNAVPRPGFLGSAVVRSTDSKNVIAVANVQHPGQGYLEAYNGFASSSATNKVSCPAILKNYYNFNTSLTVQNVGTTATNLTFNYVNGQGQTVNTVTVSNLQPNAVHARYNPNDALPDGFNGAVVVTSSGAPIVALVNELLGTGSEAGDQLFTYACSNS